MGEEQKPLSFLLPRYFLHGLFFNIIFFLLAFAWAILLVGLMILGAIIGLIIGIVILFFILGAINVFLMERIWDFRAKADWKSLLTHGLALFFVLLIVSIPSVVINFSVPSLPVAITVFIVYCFIDGYVAKAVGGMWEEIDYGEE
jgi:hypothetical protein